MDRTANHLASYGRHGDDTLLHVSREELEGIRQLTGKDFTTNPHTGLPEAFNFSNAVLPESAAVTIPFKVDEMGKIEKKDQEPQGPPGLIRRISNLGTRLGKMASGVGDSASQFLSGLGSTLSASSIPDANATLPMAFSKGGIASMRGEEGMTANVVNEAKAALLNEHPRPKEALARFEGMFGADALSMLRDKMVGGRITGAGGGMDDLIPGTIEGRQKVRLADGEFVVPADVVSGLGDGSTDHGVRRLHEMMNSVRKQRTGKTAQPKSIGGKISL